ncbi:hypothetical protein NL676_013179 [Syzygium grande]|nr:hypothetical protein NL676_013179 [Syzygium grande]
MERKLHKAAAEGDATSLVDLLKDDPLILDRCMVWSYNETPLHIAAMLGHEKFVDEILDRKPELAGELDSQKFSPPAPRGSQRYGRNPLHIAAVKGRVDVLKELVRESPDAARKKMGHGETILHLCVMYNNLEALKLLVESVGDPEFVNMKNDDGDTILHLAASDKQTETISFLTSFTTVEANSRNTDGLTAYDLLAQGGETGRSEMEPMTMRALPPNANDQNSAFPVQRKGRKKNLNKQDDWLNRKKNALMVVASLTATVAFQVGFSIMAYNDWEAYSAFLAINTLGFLASLSIILLLVSGLPLRRRFFMWILMVIIWIAITSIAVVYSFVITVFSPNNDNTIYGIVGFVVLTWVGLMVLLLVGHTIRLMLKTFRNVRKLVTRGRSSSSEVMRQDSV